METLSLVSHRFLPKSEVLQLLLARQLVDLPVGSIWLQFELKSQLVWLHWVDRTLKLQPRLSLLQQDPLHLPPLLWPIHLPTCKPGSQLLKLRPQPGVLPSTLTSLDLPLCHLDQR